jgi:predicted acetyltransferase
MGESGPVAPPRLVPPSPAMRVSFLEALSEYHDEGRHRELNAALLADPEEFPRYVAALRAEAGEPGALVRYLEEIHGAAELDPPGYEYVPQTVLWWAAGTRYLGRLAIRHRLTPQLCRAGGNIGYEVRPSARGRGHASAMLAAALPLAAELGVNPALMDCEVDNEASRRVIEKCGGRLQRYEGATLYYVVATR